VIEFPIVDSHLHVWDTQRLSYPWLAAEPRLNRSFLLRDFDADCVPVRVERMVFVQAECDFAQSTQETDWVTSLAGRDPRLQGIVSWAPLDRGEMVRTALEPLVENRLVKGVRYLLEFETDTEFCLRPGFVRGVQSLAEFDLSFDICVTRHQLHSTIPLVRKCPEVRFILDHIGKPDIKKQRFDPWRSQIKTLASMPNVWCKLSGVPFEADHEHWTREELKPYIDHVVACFGLRRVMYGGDWPVALLANDYPRWVQTLRWALRDCSDDELGRVFRDNAIEFYRLA